MNKNKKVVILLILFIVILASFFLGFNLKFKEKKTLEKRDGLINCVCSNTNCITHVSSSLWIPKDPNCLINRESCLLCCMNKNEGN